MQVNCSVTIVSGDNWTLSPSEAAAAILTALGGDETKDVVNLSVVGSGAAGNIPQPAPVMDMGAVPNPVPPFDPEGRAK